MDLIKAKQDFLQYEKMIGSQPKTIDHYSAVIDLFFNVSVYPDSDLSLQNVYKFADYMNDKGLSVGTKANYLRHIKAFYHFLCRSSIIAEKTLWQEIRLPKSEKKIVQVYDEMEISEIYAASSVDPDWLAARNRCIISIMLDCGLRQTEVVKLAFSDVSGSVILVHGKGRNDRIVSKGLKLQSDLNKWLLLRPVAVCDTDRLFLSRSRKPITNDTIKMLFQHITKEVGYSVSSHRLRHNFATNFLLDSYEKNGWFDSYSLMTLMGHEDLKTTERYLHYCQQVIACRNAHSHLDKIFNFSHLG